MQSPSASKVNRAWWACDAGQLLLAVQSADTGLTTAAARARQSRGAGGPDQGSALRLLLSQFTSPLVLILVAAALLSLLLREWLDAAIILVIVVGSGLLGFTQEHSASKAVEALKRRLVQRVRLVRDGEETILTIDDVVAGDVALLRAGDLVPGDGRILQSDALLVDEAVLSGEAFPVEKMAGVSPPQSGVSQRTGALFQGSSIRSGTCRMLVLSTGADTEFGKIERDLAKAEESTEFSRGLAKFGGMLMRVMLVVVVLVLAAATLLGRDIMTSLLFAMALAVAISPELLPAIVSVTLAAGAQRMAQHGVLVRRLEAIENLGGMDVLCTDKTGTLTSGTIALSAAVDPLGSPSVAVLRLAAINASQQTSMQSALDEAVATAATAAGIADIEAEKLREIAYDFVRRRYTVEARLSDGTTLVVTKGAVSEVLESCGTVRKAQALAELAPSERLRIDAFVKTKSLEGLRILAVSSGEEGSACLEGFLLFSDPPKPGIEQAVADMRARGVSVRIVSGDNRHVSAHLAQSVGLEPGETMTGDAIASLSDEELASRVRDIRVFAEVEPQQKQRIVRAFRAAGHAVGYMGDGINDAPALRAADVGISVDSAVDVARESADIVLLRPDLTAIRSGIEDGRRTFANTLKYIAITISANFGNMISMAVATVLLPFLPLLPSQILLNNFLSDLPAVAIATDLVDAERVSQAQRWDITRIRNFMILFGLLSTAFDLLTFGLLRLVVEADAQTFRTSWFVLSLLTELVALLVLRTRRWCWNSRPSAPLLWSCIGVGLLAVALPYSGSIASFFELSALPLYLTAALLGLALAYGVVTELAKRHQSDRRS